MRLLKYAILASLAVSAPAFAADLAPAPVEPVAPLVVPYSWTGFYAGVHAGAVFGQAKLVSLKENSTGFIGGAHAGYNLQFDNNIVVGVEGDIDYTSLSKKRLVDSVQGSGVDAGLFSAEYLKFKSDWQGSVRARLGYAFDRFLPYVTAGVAFGDEKYKIDVTSNVPDFPTGTAPSSKTVVGWTAGGGLEYAIDDHWSIRGEVRYSDFGKKSFRFPNIGDLNGGIAKGRFTEVTTELGVSYKF